MVGLALFKHRANAAGLFAGLGAGIATNLVAKDFNKIERREFAITEELEGNVSLDEGSKMF